MKPWWLRNVKMDGAEGNGGTGGTGGGEVKLEDIAKHVNMLTQLVAGLAGGMKEMQTAITGMPDTFKELIPQQNNSQSRQSSDDDDLSNVDLEQLDRRQFGTLLVGQVLKKLDGMMDSKMKEFGERIENVQNTVARDLGSRQLQEVQGKHADVLEWKDEIKDVLSKNPNLSLAQAYVLARNENPAKAESMDKKYKGDDDGKGGKGDVFFGLTPTSTGTAPSEKSGRRMEFSQAAETALDNVMAQLGGGSIDSVARLTR